LYLEWSIEKQPPLIKISLPGKIKLKSNFIQTFRSRENSIQRSFLEEGGKKSSQAVLALLIFTLALQVLSIWNLELSGRDSPRVAGIAREMTVTSNYLIPRLNGENFLEYPPLGYWPIALTLSMSEKPPDFLAFLPMVFFGAGTVLITYLVGKRLAGGQIGLMAGFLLATMSSFITYHRHFRVDPVLLFFITLSLYGFTISYQTSRKSFSSFKVFYLAMAGAFLSKGVIGVAIPAATAVVFLITRKDFQAIRKLLLNPGILLFLLPIFIWVGSVWWFEGTGIVKEVIRQSLWRFLSPSADHAKPVYYYFIPVFLAPMPWTLLLIVLLWFRWGSTHSKEPLPHGSLLRFALVWFLTGFIGLSLASAKRPLYLGPVYPSFALLAALGWDRIREKFPKIKRLEVYGLIVIFFIYVGTYLLFITPSEREKSLRPVFEAVSSQRTNGPVYLVNPSETLQGASFFYLGKRIPVLRIQDLSLGRFEDRPGTTLVLDAYLDNSQYGSDIRSKGYRLILKQKFGKDGICVYSNGS
jgi:4-amino-4-deoxy-L-arabinose transferase-like glycosyltransferase